MRFLVAICLALLATPAMAKDVTITLNDDEQKAFMTLLDSAVRQGGLNSIPQVWKFVQKLQAAIAVPAAPATATPAKPETPKH